MERPDSWILTGLFALLLPAVAGSQESEIAVLADLDDEAVFGLIAADWETPVEMLAWFPVEHEGQAQLIVLWTYSPVERWEGWRRQRGDLERNDKRIAQALVGCEKKRAGPHGGDLYCHDECLSRSYPYNLGRCYEGGSLCRTLELSRYEVDDQGAVTRAWQITLQKLTWEPRLDRISLADFDDDGKPELEVIYTWNTPPHAAYGVLTRQHIAVLDAMDFTGQLDQSLLHLGGVVTAHQTRFAVHYEDTNGDGHRDAIIHHVEWAPVCPLDAHGWPFDDPRQPVEGCVIYEDKETKLWGVEGDKWGVTPPYVPIAPNK